MKVNKGQTSNRINTELKRDVPGYARNGYQTYLTAPEWRNVDMAVEMANFLETGKPFYRYPYFRQIKTFWYIFFQSLNAAHKDHTWLRLVFSEYTLMNTFIGVWTTAECLLKGFISIPFWLTCREENNTQFQKHVAKMHNDYQEFIHHTPFFLYSYFDKIGPLWKAYWHATDKSFADMVTLAITTIELLVRTIPSFPARRMYSQAATTENQTQEASTDEQKIHILLKSRIDENILLEYVNNDSKKLMETRSKNYVDIKYLDVVLPRYVKFKNVISELAKNEVVRRDSKLKRIAGNNSIMVDFTANTSDMSKILEKFGQNLLFSYGDSIDNNKVMFAARINADDLLQTVYESNLEGSKFKLKLIHDF